MQTRKPFLFKHLRTLFFNRNVLWNTCSRLNNEFQVFILNVIYIHFVFATWGRCVKCWLLVVSGNNMMGKGISFSATLHKMFSFAVPNSLQRIPYRETGIKTKKIWISTKWKKIRKIIHLDIDVFGLWYCKYLSPERQCFHSDRNWTSGFTHLKENIYSNMITD